jgi:xanthine dehydrogenase accessory factor
MLFADYLVILRGGGDLATGVAYRLNQAGFPVIVLEIEKPLAVRRRVSLATAVLEEEIVVDGIRGVRANDLSQAFDIIKTGSIPVVISQDLPKVEHLPLPDNLSKIPVLIDARMAKRNIDTSLRQADLVIALGPGFKAGVDCHVVIETKRGHRLGRTIWRGGAIPDTGRPGRIDGKAVSRVLRAPASGVAVWEFEIGDMVKAGQVIGSVAGEPIQAPFDGVIRGLIAPGFNLPAGIKVGDVDPRGDVAACFSISDKALSIGGGVLEAMLVWINRQARQGYSHEQ